MKPAKTAASAPIATSPAESVTELNPPVFRRRLSTWFRRHARSLPWRATSDPYRIWVSEIMLQQTRVAAVILHYSEFLRRFPSLLSLALAPEADVLAAWSGLGYYRRARMLHRAAHFIVLERDGILPTSSTELRTLPGIGEYTAAAIASIAFGESLAVVDGNVERVILRLTGRAEVEGAQLRAFIRTQAQALMPAAASRKALAAAPDPPESTAARAGTPRARPKRAAIAAAEDATSPTNVDPESSSPPVAHNPPGDHNQAMMELGATICLPRAPLCLQCPVHALCRTRGEHITPRRAAQLSRPVAYLLDLRKDGTATEVLLEYRSAEASLMPSMYELPPLPMDAVEGREPVLRVRHSITNTNYYVQVYAPSLRETAGSNNRSRSEAHTLREAIPAATNDLEWVRTSRLGTLPLTGLARKILKRLNVMESPRLAHFE